MKNQKLLIGGGVVLALLALAAFTVLNRKWWVKRIVSRYEIEPDMMADDTLKRLIETYYQMPGSITLVPRGTSGATDHLVLLQDDEQAQ